MKMCSIFLLFTTLSFPAVADVEQEVIEAINKIYDYVNTHNAPLPGVNSERGETAFASHGGLLSRIPHRPDTGEIPPPVYEWMNVKPKHIEIHEMTPEIALAFFYTEGSFKTLDGLVVRGFRNRVLEVFVKEDGKWVVYAGHWSPLAAGKGLDG